VSNVTLQAPFHLHGLPDTAGASGARLRGLGAFAVEADETLQVGVVNSVEVQLGAPRRGYHRGIQARIGAREQAVLAFYDLPQGVFLILG
jgi:hypothetical protein